MKVQAAYIFALARTLRELGCDPSEIIRSDHPIDDIEFFELTTQAVAKTGDPSFALRFGSALHLGSHGVLGQALMSCRTLRQAAEFLVQHNPVKNAEVGIRFAFDQESAVLSVMPAIEVPGAPNFLVEALFAAVVTGIEELVGSDLEGSRIEFAFAPRMPEEVYRRYLRVPLAFGKPMNRLIGPRDLVDQPLPAAANAMADLYVRQCGKLLRERGGAVSYTSEVRRVLMSSRGHVPNEYEVAKALHVSGRTLRRRLLCEGASFQIIRDEVRNRLARSYLIETRLSIAEVGTLLGFEDAANFRRAFRRWNGCSPQQYREAAGDQKPPHRAAIPPLAEAETAAVLS